MWWRLKHEHNNLEKGNVIEDMFNRWQDKIYEVPSSLTVCLVCYLGIGDNG